MIIILTLITISLGNIRIFHISTYTAMHQLRRAPRKSPGGTHPSFIRGGYANFKRKGTDPFRIPSRALFGPFTDPNAGQISLSFHILQLIPTPGSLPFCLYTWNLKKVLLTSVNLMLCISVSGHSSETTIYLTDVGYKTLETRGLVASWILLSTFCHSGLFTFQYTSFRKLRFRDQ